jgi:hypothetical protein
MLCADSVLAKSFDDAVWSQVREVDCVASVYVSV